jgi:hypothetical protein
MVYQDLNVKISWTKHGPPYGPCLDHLMVQVWTVIAFTFMAQKDRRLRWTPTPHVEAGLIRMEKLGIFGRDRSEIVNHVIGEELRRLLQSGLLKREELEAAVDSLPESGDDDSSSAA